MNDTRRVLGEAMKVGWCAALLLAGAHVAGGATQIKEGFESGTFSGWNVQGEGWSVYAKAASEGEKSAMVAIQKNEPAGLKAAVRLVEKAEAGWVVQVRMDVAGKVRTNSSQFTVSLVCVDQEGGILREVEKKVAEPSTNFSRISLPELVVPSGTVETYLMIVVEVPDAAKSSEWWRFDNVVVELK